MGTSRRSVLRGLGGCLLGLPALELTHAKPWGDPDVERPGRFVLTYCGMSTGADGAGDALTPLDDGALSSSRALQPLFAMGVQASTSLVSGLRIPWQTSGAVPAAGRPSDFHYRSAGPLVAGTRSSVASGAPTAPTADQLVADRLGGQAPLGALSYGIQPVSYVGENASGGNSGRLSWKHNESGALVPVDPVVSPRAAYEMLIGLSGGGAGSRAEALALLRRRHSALDLVQERIIELQSKVGRADAIRLEQHYDEVRALETRLDVVTPAACSAPGHPGDDPPIGGAIVPWDDHPEEYSAQAGYSGEDQRSQVFIDLVTYALSCELCNVASLLLSQWKSYMNMYSVAGWQADLHALTHSASLEAVADGIAWHVKQFARLVLSLDSTPDLNGLSLLDSTAAVLVFEGGFGASAEATAEPNSHSTENMAVLVAGRPDELVLGQHLRGNGSHPASVVLGAMRAVGVQGGLGEITEPFAPILES